MPVAITALDAPLDGAYLVSWITRYQLVHMFANVFVHVEIFQPK